MNPGVRKNCHFAMSEDDMAKLSDRTIARQAIVMEFQAVSSYEQMASQVKDSKLKKVLLDVAREEKVHAIEFETALGGLDKEHSEAVEEGKKEAEEI